MTTTFPADLPELADDLHEALVAAVGAEHVRIGPDLEAYADPYSFLEDNDTPHPVAAVLPASVGEVQAVVAAAVASGTPLWTVSRGRNYAYGGAAALVPGSIVLDLGRLNQVLEVNDEMGYVVVEPGVSFLALYAHLREAGSALLMSVPDIGWGSVLANALERGIGYARHGDHSEQLCGMEVVMADGSLVRTGMGALPGSTAGPLYKGGFGPSVDGLFLQSNLGIVTKVAVWLAPRPQTVVVCSLQVDSDDELGPLVDVLRQLQLDRTIDCPVTIGSAGILAVVLSERSRWHTGPGVMADDEIERVVQELGVGYWNGRFALYGPDHVVQAQLSVVQQALAGLTGVSLSSQCYPGDVGPEAVSPPHLSQLGVPTMAMARMAEWRGGEPAHTDISLVCPTRGEDVLRQRDLVKALVRRHGFDYAGGFTLYGRHTISLALVAFDRSDQQQRSAVRALFSQVVDEAAALGYAPYRAHTAFMDLIADRYCAGDDALRRTVEKIKDALDPVGVLSPGKQGVWPGRSHSAASTGWRESR